MDTSKKSGLWDHLLLYWRQMRSIKFQNQTILFERDISVFVFLAFYGSFFALETYFYVTIIKILIRPSQMVLCHYLTPNRLIDVDF
jgi:hypothetical protein